MVWSKPAAKSKCIVANNLVGGWDLPTPQQGTFFGHVIPYPGLQTVGILDNPWLYLCPNAKSVKKWFNHFFNILGDK